ncbi:hypothetical protein [Clostridium sardiniense]|uniref:hypothetical protein n=1 Tax=Clostridium sardiniense TaxID=29369 RepID=UPI003D34E228
MKKIVFINGSPKGKKSGSEYFLERIESKLNISDDNIKLSKINIKDRSSKRDSFKLIKDSDIVVIAFPLYVDTLPSTVIEYLEEFEDWINMNGYKVNKINLYGVVNCGFYEGEQTKIAIRVLKNYCNSLGIKWCGGIGIGAGEFFSGSQNIPWQAKIKEDARLALDNMKDCIIKGQAMQTDIFVTAKLNKRIFLLGGSYGWIYQGIKNGVSIRSLWNKPHIK